MKSIVKKSEDLMYLTGVLPKFTQIKPKCHNNSILFTGAGFLTIHILKEIAKNNTYKKIYVIVRNYEKFLNNAELFQFDVATIPNIIFITSDLVNISLDLLPEVEFVIHNAAQMHALKNLDQLYVSNVLVTNKLSQIYQNQKFIFISTLSVFVSSNLQGNHIEETLPIDDVYSLYGGYAQSKFIGEKIVEKQCKNYKIIRLGLLTGSSIDGQLQNDFLTQFISNLLSLKIIPNTFENSFVDFTPIDIASKLILDNVNSSCEIIHIANKQSISLQKICSHLELERVEPLVFSDAIKKLSNINYYLMLFGFFKSEAKKQHFNYYNLDLFQSTNHWYNIKNPFMISNDELIDLYIESIQKLKDSHV